MNRSAMLIGGALVAVALVGGGMHLELRRDPSLPPGALDAIDAMDQDVIAQLKKNGSDVTKPTDVEHFLYIPSRRDAEEASRRLIAAGYRAAVEEPLGKFPDGTAEMRYSVHAHKNTVPSIENVRRARALFETLARQYGGEYDGWDAAVVK